MPPKGIKRCGTIAALSAGIIALIGSSALHHLLQRTPGATFERDGVPLYYFERGEGEPLLLLHGFAVNGDLNWRVTGVLDALSPHFRVIVMDLRGHGLSGKPHDPAAYGVTMAEDVIHLMDHLGVERAHVAGYSLGGYIALKLAAIAPERILSVACMGAGWLDPENPSSRAMLDSIMLFAEQLEAGRAVEPIASPISEGAHRTTWFHRLQVRAVSGLLGDKKALAALIRTVEGLSITREDLLAIAIPLIAICGDIDPNYVTAQRLAETHPACELVTIENRSHPGAVSSRQLHAALLAFLQEEADS